MDRACGCPDPRRRGGWARTLPADPIHCCSSSETSIWGFVLLPLQSCRKRGISPPTDHRTFLGLAAQGRLLGSDSDRVQKDSTVLERPLIVVRNSTDAPNPSRLGSRI